MNNKDKWKQLKELFSTDEKIFELYYKLKQRIIKGGNVFLIVMNNNSDATKYFNELVLNNLDRTINNSSKSIHFDNDIIKVVSINDIEEESKIRGMRLKNVVFISGDD